MAGLLNKIAGDFTLENSVHDHKEYSILDQINDVDQRLVSEFNGRLSELNKYALMLENPKDLENRYSRMRILNNMSYGFRKSTEAVAWASMLVNESKSRRKRAEAIAQHDNFPEYVERKKEEGKIIKTTDTFVKSYVDIDECVTKARREEALILAMYLQFLGLKQEFSQGISTLKTVFSPYAEEQQLSSGAEAIGFDDQI